MSLEVFADLLHRIRFHRRPLRGSRIPTPRAESTRSPLIEALEQRQMLSAVPAPLVSAARPLRTQRLIAQAPYLGIVASVPGTIQAERFDRGGETIANHDLTPLNEGELFRPRDGVDLDVALDERGGYSVARTRAGEWMEYTINVRYTASYNLAVRVASRGLGGAFHISVDNVRKTGPITVPDTGGAQAWITLDAGRITLKAGRHMLRLVMASSRPGAYVGRFNWLSLTLSPPAAPADLAVTTENGKDVVLTWADNSNNETAFRLERRSVGDEQWQVVTDAPANTTRYVDTGSSIASGDEYRIMAINPAGVSTYAGPASLLMTFAPPIVITAGGVYTGAWESNDPATPAVRVETDEPVVIDSAIIRSRGTLILTRGAGANLTVRNTTGSALNPNLSGQYPGRFIIAEGFVSLLVENNHLEGTSGIYVHDYRGNYAPDQTIKVLRNTARNIDGRFSDGDGGYQTVPGASENVQFFQTNGIHDLPGLEVAWNQVINDPGNSLVEDNINIFDSNGTPTSPFLIHDNYIQGAYPANPTTDTDYSGGGIMLSDNGSRFVRAYRNQVVGTTNYGIAISSGSDNEFYENRIISSGLLPTGESIPAQNVGAYIWNQNGELEFDRNSGRNNLVGWVLGRRRNDWWVPDASSWTGNTAWSGSVTQLTEAAEFALWQQKVEAAGLHVGPQTVLAGLG